MTVLNAITQAGRAYIITDTAWMADDGRVVALASKFIQGLAFPFLIAITGNADPFYIGEKIEAGRPRNGCALLQVLASALQESAAAETALDVGFLVATWNKRFGRPMLHLLSNTDTHWPGFTTPFVPCAIESVIGGQITAEEALGRSVDLANPGSFNPYRDGAILIEAQRKHHRFEHLGTPAYRIGGAVEVGMLARKGTKIEQLGTWPEDRIGQLIEPVAPMVPVLDRQTCAVAPSQ